MRFWRTIDAIWSNDALQTLFLLSIIAFVLLIAALYSNAVKVGA